MMLLPLPSQRFSCRPTTTFNRLQFRLSANSLHLFKRTRRRHHHSARNPISYKTRTNLFAQAATTTSISPNLNSIQAWVDCSAHKAELMMITVAASAASVHWDSLSQERESSLKVRQAVPGEKRKARGVAGIKRLEANTSLIVRWLSWHLN